MEENRKGSDWWLPLLLAVLFMLGGLVGHFAFPKVEVRVEVQRIVEKDNAQYGTWNFSTISIYVDERTGNCSIYGLRPGNLWIGDVDGLSMWPTMKDGSRVIAEEVQPQDGILVGDIVLFDYNNRYLVHRVVDISTDEDGWYALTVGDNMDLSEDEVPLYLKCRRNEIWGKVRIYIDY